MSEKKRAGYSRLQKMSTYDDLVDQASEDKKITLDRIGPKMSNQNEVEIPIEELHTFPDHPFKVIDDEAMQSLADSIGNRGVLHPIVVRVDPKGGYQIISGHRRRFACEKAGLKTVPAYIVEIDDDEAIILMTDANFYQREGLLPSEKAKAYRMKSDAIKRHQGTSTGKHTIDEIGEGTNDSSTQIKRYIRLSFLCDDLLNLVDAKKIGIDQGVQLSFLMKEQQNIVFDVFEELLEDAPTTMTIQQAKDIREAAEKEKFSRELVISLMLSKDKSKRKITFNDVKLREYFSDDYSVADIEDIIIDLLKKWKEGENRG